MSQDLWSAWSGQASIWLGLALAVLLYGRGTWAVWKRAGAGHGIRLRQAAFFFGGLLACVVALLSPLDYLAEQLLAAHMVQHLLLIMVAAPLIVLGQPATALAWALPRPARLSAARSWHHARWLRGAWHWLTRPAVAWSLHLGILWVWHVPALYQAALADERIHAVEHLLFLGTAVLFWQALVVLGGRQRAGYGAGVLYLFATALAETPLGALMLFSNQPWYADYVATAPAFGMSALGDQQLAGSIMWVPPSLAMLFVAAVMFVAWLEALEKRMREAEQRSPAIYEPMRLIVPPRTHATDQVEPVHSRNGKVPVERSAE